MKISKATWAQLTSTALLLLISIISVWQIETLPPGAYYDEVFEIQDAKRLYAGEFPLFFEGNNGRQPLYTYLIALVGTITGLTPPVVRLAARLPLIGIVFATMKTAEALFGKRVGWLAALITLSTVAVIHLGRLGQRISYLPLFFNLGTWQLVLALKTRQWRHWILCGIFFGLTYYTYAPNSFVPVALAGVAALAFIFYRSALRAVFKPALVASAIALFIATPLNIYYLQNSEAGSNRNNQLATGTLGQTPDETFLFLQNQVGKIAGMFALAGDPNPRHNIPERPFFDPIINAFLLIGSVACLRNRRTVFLGLSGLIWLAIFLIPTYLTESAPHFNRGVGIYGSVFFFPALGVVVFHDSLKQKLGQLLALIVSAGLMLGSLYITAHDYFFSNFLSSATTFEAFNGRLTLPITTVNRLLNAGWTGDNLIAKPLRPPNFTIWIEPELWQQSIYTDHLATVLPDQQSYFRTLKPDAQLAPPFALILSPKQPAYWLAKIPADAKVFAQPMIVGNKVFTIYRSSELENQPYSESTFNYQWLHERYPSGTEFLSAEYPKEVVSGETFEITAHFSSGEKNSNSKVRFDLLAPNGASVAINQDLFTINNSFAIVMANQTTPLGTPAGEYALKATLINAETGQIETPIKRVELGTIKIISPKVAPSLHKLGLTNRANQDLGGVTLVGYNFDRAGVRQGDTVFITFYFYVNGNSLADQPFNLFTPYLPTSQWRHGEVLRFVSPVRVPADVVGNYQFKLALNQFPEKAILLNPINVIPIQRTFTAPTIQNTTALKFNNVIELAGYNRKENQLELIWKALGTLDKDLIAFIHVEDATGKIIAQSDAVPADWSRSTTGWVAGEYIVDLRTLPPLPNNGITVYLGLAERESGERFGERLIIYKLP